MAEHESTSPRPTRSFPKELSGIQGWLINGLIAAVAALAGGGVGATTTAGSLTSEFREFRVEASAQFRELKQDIKNNGDVQGRQIERLERDVTDLQHEVEQLKLWRASQGQPAH